MPLTQNPETIAQALTQIGLEVEHVDTFETIRGGLRGVVVGEVVTCEKHPNADKLSKTTVDVGNGVILPIVCGAPNVAAGQKVLVATVGTMLFPTEGEPFEIKKAKIRGEASEGMICAEDELGIGTSHEGIMVLDTDLPNGTPAATLLNIETDHVFEIGLTPNRADAASHWGVARDLKALWNLSLCVPEGIELSQAKTSQKWPIAVKVENTEACPRYSGICISGVKVQPSPEWLQNRLRSIGLNPINNVVDITNFVLHELGQPLHAFDAEKIKGNAVIIKTLPDQTPFVTLDGQTRKLHSQDLMICNDTEPMCIAGVFGGLESGVTEQTKHIFLESAYFNPTYVRKTAQRFGLKTDASFRFERGTNPDSTVLALQRAAKLLVEIAGGEISSELIDVYPQPVKPFEVPVSYANITRLIGKDLGKEFIHQTLANLEITLTQQTDLGFTAWVPPYRVDVQREADIIEDLLRLYGFDNITLPTQTSTTYIADFPPKSEHLVEDTIAQLLATRGFNEMVNNSLTKPGYAEKLTTVDTAQNVVMLNKLSEELEVMRQSMIFSGLETIVYNQNRKQKNLKLFEFGKTYHYHADKEVSHPHKRYEERNHLALFMTGQVQAESWQNPDKALGFHDLAAVLTQIFKKLAVSPDEVKPSENPDLAYGLAYFKNKKLLAEAGLLQPALAKFADVKQPVWYADIDWTLLSTAHQRAKFVYQEIPKFPEVRRDLSLVIDNQVSFQAIEALTFAKERKLIQSINVFDVYAGENLGEGKIAYALSYVLQDENQTLTDQVVDKVMDKLMKAYEQELGAVIRK